MATYPTSAPLVRSDLEQVENIASEIRLEQLGLRRWLEQHITWLLVASITFGVASCVLAFSVMIVVLAKL